MGEVQCCKKDEPVETELNLIFAECPEDNKEIDDTGFFGNQGGEYPTDTGHTARFGYESRYPSYKLDPPPSSKLRTVTPKPQSYKSQNCFTRYSSYYGLNNIKQNINFNDPNCIEKLYEMCRMNGKVKPYDDFKLSDWKKFYPRNDRFFNWKKGNNIIENQTKVYNINDLNNVEIYKGDLNYDNQRHGIGKLTTPHYVRIGTWRNDKFTGWGRESRRNGQVLEGRFVNGLLNGKGILINAKGGKYVGDFVDSKKEGKGEMISNKIHYIGEFNNNKMDGKGKIKFLLEGHTYEGEFHANEINGVGIFKWMNGDTYEGEMIDGQMNGFGTYKYKNGIIYVGHYINGVKDGQGKLIYPNGNIYEGNFKNGRPVEKN